MTVLAPSAARMSREDVARVLGRPQWDIPVDEPLSKLAGKQILVTGATGSLGTALRDVLPDRTVFTDIGDLDVRYAGNVQAAMELYRPDVVFHLAGAKHAPEGEISPAQVAQTNVSGTANVVWAARRVGAKVVLASTCKACDPETVYGASKLIAERIVLEAGGSVARLFNVVETCGNVFELWRDIPDADPLPVAVCGRYFLALEEAVGLLLWAAVLPSGRYIVDPVRRRNMRDVVADLYPGRVWAAMAPRRGDRQREPLSAASETILATRMKWLKHVISPHEAAV